MPFMYKISLVGTSGAGKTTTLKALSPNAYIFSEMKRKTTEIEAKAWKISMGTEINTTVVPNFLPLLLDKRHRIKKLEEGYELKDFTNDPSKKDDTVLMIFDTCGQEIFYDLTRSTTLGSNGILLIIDSSIPMREQRDSLINAYSEVISHFNDSSIPIAIMLNKQDLWEKLANTLLGYEGKIRKIKMCLDEFIPELKHCKIFSASALKGWGIEEPIKYLTKKIKEGMKHSSLVPNPTS